MLQKKLRSLIGIIGVVLFSILIIYLSIKIYYNELRTNLSFDAILFALPVLGVLTSFYLFSRLFEKKNEKVSNEIKENIDRSEWSIKNSNKEVE